MRAPSLSDYARYATVRDRDQPRGAGQPEVSVITVCLNAASSIARTIDSVRAQSRARIEQIFVDGGSTDDTVAIIRRKMRPGDYCLSEADRGISDAFNKGIAMCRGRYIQILNADDWLSTDQIERAVAAIESKNADFSFGDLTFYEHGKPAFFAKGDPDYARCLDRRMPSVGHPTVLASWRCFRGAGLFDLRYRNAMDYDWLLRVHRAGLRGVYSDRIRGHMTYDGISNRHFQRTIDEVRRIAIAHGRSSVLANLEAQMRLTKTTLSLAVKKRALPLYKLIRRSINPAYSPLS